MAEVKEISASSISTESRVEMWWLCMCKGYRVVLIRRIPQRQVFGRLYYRSVWVLRPNHRRRPVQNSS